MCRIQKRLAITMLMATVVIAVGCTKTDIPNNGGNNGGNNSGGSNNSHSYVDLGLPSGVLWATCNIGAGTPEAYGYYFAWGETTPKTSYSWGLYRYGRWDDRCQLTKYCNNSSYGENGFTDNLTVLQANDDAASINWGNGWRTPTYNDWNELLSYCTQTFSTRNGVNGWLFTAPNGKSIFLPAAGYRYDENLNQVGNNGCYWSSSLNVSNPIEAWDFIFSANMNLSRMNTADRANGRSIRPIRAAH